MVVDEGRIQRGGGCKVQALEEREQGHFIQVEPPLGSPLRRLCAMVLPRDRS